MPESVYVSSEIVTMLGDLTAIADVGTYFSLPAYATSSSTATSITAVPPMTNTAASVTNLNINSSNNPAIAVTVPSSPPSATTPVSTAVPMDGT